jgi:hypothetical protein
MENRPAKGGVKSWPYFFDHDLFIEHLVHFPVELPELSILIDRKYGSVIFKTDPELQFVISNLHEAAENNAGIRHNHAGIFRQFLETETFRYSK